MQSTSKIAHGTTSDDLPSRMSMSNCFAILIWRSINSSFPLEIRPSLFNVYTAMDLPLGCTVIVNSTTKSSLRGSFRFVAIAVS